MPALTPAVGPALSSSTYSSQKGKQQGQAQDACPSNPDPEAMTEACRPFCWPCHAKQESHFEKVKTEAFHSTPSGAWQYVKAQGCRMGGESTLGFMGEHVRAKHSSVFPFETWVNCLAVRTLLHL